MAEFQNTSVASGEMAQRFIEFVLMQAQNAAFVLGQIPHPQSGKAEVNLDLARLLIDQLVMIQEKTKGNLNKDEAQILANTLSSLQIAFVETAQKERSGRKTEPAQSVPASTEPQPQSKIETPTPEGPATSESEGKKKFVKSYGS